MSDPAEPVRSSRLSGRAKLAIAAVCVLLGVGLAVQTRITSETERDLRGARQEDLVRILDDLDNQHDRIGKELSDLSGTKDELASGGDQAAAAQEQAQQRLDELEILNGTVAATGPGITMTITDAPASVPADMMITVIQELRAAGAEAIQVGQIRIGMSSAVTSKSGAILIDGHSLSFPLTILAIGDPDTLSTAMGIPGGAIAAVSYAGAKATVTPSDKVDITALREPKTPDYAEPAEPS